MEMESVKTQEPAERSDCEGGSDGVKHEPKIRRGTSGEKRAGRGVSTHGRDGCLGEKA